MTKLRPALLVLVLLALVLTLVGCGGDTSRSTPSPAASPLDLASPLAVSPQAVGPALTDGAEPLQDRVGVGGASWYRLPAGTGDVPWVITMYQGAFGDADLRVFQLSAPKGALATLGSSLRTPSSTAPDATSGGFNPDWVFALVAPTIKAQVGVFGVSGSSNPLYYIEADVVRDLLPAVQTPLTHTVGGGGSRWYRIHVTTAAPYTVRVTGSPQVFVYKTDSSHFIRKNTPGGGGNVAFNGSSSTDYFVRVYSFEDTTFKLTLTTP